MKDLLNKIVKIPGVNCPAEFNQYMNLIGFEMYDEKNVSSD